MLRVEDIGELAYGGLVVGLKRWDEGRAVGDEEILKKAGFWGYLVPGLFATTSTAMKWMPRQDAWLERISHGFIYGFPGFVMELVDAFGGGTAAAVREAERIVRTPAKKAGWRPQGIIA